MLLKYVGFEVPQDLVHSNFTHTKRMVWMTVEGNKFPVLFNEVI